MSAEKNSETGPRPLHESYQPEPTEQRGYVPLSHKPAGKPPNFTPPPGSGAPSGGGGSQPQSSGGGDSSGGSEE